MVRVSECVGKESFRFRFAQTPRHNEQSAESTEPTERTRTHTPRTSNGNVVNRPPQRGFTISLTLAMFLGDDQLSAPFKRRSSEGDSWLLATRPVARNLVNAEAQAAPQQPNRIAVCESRKM